MASRVASTRTARADLAGIWHYIAEHNPGAARRHLVQLAAQFEFLAMNREAGRLRSELVAGLRSWPVGNYVVFYRPISAGILVVRVIHASRDIGGLPWSG